MQKTIISILLTLVIFAVPINSQAETAYIIDKLMVGVHKDKTLDSPIIKTFPTGTEFQVLGRDGKLANVRDANGFEGWIDSQYLMADKPARDLIKAVRDKSSALEAELKGVKTKMTELEAKQTRTDANTSDSAVDLNAIMQENEDLKQQFNSERQKLGELQVKLAELRKLGGAENIIDSLSTQIEKLTQEKNELAEQLAHSIGSYDPGISNTVPSEVNPSFWQNFICLLIATILGVLLGFYLLDYHSRKRHGGFRV